MTRRKNPVTVRQVTPQGARRRLNKQAAERAAKAQRSGAFLIGQHDPSEAAKQQNVKPPRARRRSGPQATDYVPEAYSRSQTANGKSTQYMKLGTGIRKRRTRPYRSHIEAGMDQPVRQRVVPRRRDGTVRGEAVWTSETGK